MKIPQRVESYFREQMAYGTSRELERLILKAFEVDTPDREDSFRRAVRGFDVGAAFAECFGTPEAQEIVSGIQQLWEIAHAGQDPLPPLGGNFQNVLIERLGEAGKLQPEMIKDISALVQSTIGAEVLKHFQAAGFVITQPFEVIRPCLGWFKRTETGFRWFVQKAHKNLAPEQIEGFKKLIGAVLVDILLHRRPETDEGPIDPGSF